MKPLSKEELALLTLCGDIIHDILYQRKKDFVLDIKQNFITLERCQKYILKRCYGNQSLEEFDIHRDELVELLLQSINGKFKLKE